jgi:DNA-binding MarR family transcriptional regulator
MHYIVDNNGTFDGENRLENPGNELVWREIMDAIHANGETVTMASNGMVDRKELKKRGFSEDEFSEILEITMKDDKLLERVSEKHQIPVKDICVIENDTISVFIIRKFGAQAIEYKGAHDLKEQLIAQKKLNFGN